MGNKGTEGLITEWCLAVSPKYYEVLNLFATRLPTRAMLCNFRKAGILRSLKIEEVILLALLSGLRPTRIKGCHPTQRKLFRSCIHTK